MVYLFYGSGWEFMLISYFLNYECKKLEALMFGLTLTKILLLNFFSPWMKILLKVLKLQCIVNNL